MARKKLVTGIEEVRKAFRDLPEENTVRITDALNRGAEEIAERARLLAPHDPDTPIDLKDQIETRIATRTNSTRAVREGGSTDPNSVAAYVIAGEGKERFWAAIKQEFGRPPGPGRNPGHPAQPFMYPAFFSIRKRVIGRVRRAVKAAAKASAARNRNGAG